MAIKNLDSRPTLSTSMGFVFSKHLLDFVIDFSFVYKHKWLFLVIDKTEINFVQKSQIQTYFDQKSCSIIQRLRELPNNMLRL